MTTPKEPSTGERLAVIETTVKHIERLLLQEVQSVKDTQGQMQKLSDERYQSVLTAIEKKADKEDLTELKVVVHSKADAKSLAPWHEGLRAIVVAIVIAVVVGGGGYSLGKRQDHQMQERPAQAPASPAGSSS